MTPDRGDALPKCGDWVRPPIQGVGRMFDNEKAVLVMFRRKLTDDELRALHEFLRGFRP